MRAEEMLALVGGDHLLSRDPSGGSLSNFGNLFSDEASKAELQRALQGFSQELMGGASQLSDRDDHYGVPFAY